MNGTQATNDQQTALAKREARSVSYVPFGENEQITLSIGTIRSLIAAKTKSGATPNEVDLIKFMMLCKARALNPWVGDAYLVGYDTKDGPQYSLITAIQALLKRAEANEQFNGLTYGVIVQRDEGELLYRDGDLVLKGETLIGGWARCYRKNLEHPVFDALNFDVFNQGHSRWTKDPAGMIVKCAQASVLRTAFPTQLGGLYLSQEISDDHDGATIDATASVNSEPERPRLRETNAEQRELSEYVAEKVQEAFDAGKRSKPRSRNPFPAEAIAERDAWEAGKKERPKATTRATTQQDSSDDASVATQSDIDKELEDDFRQKAEQQSKEQKRAQFSGSVSDWWGWIWAARDIPEDVAILDRNAEGDDTLTDSQYELVAGWIDAAKAGQLTFDMKPSGV